MRRMRGLSAEWVSDRLFGEMPESATPLLCPSWGARIDDGVSNNCRSQEYVGGVRWRHINATWPLARLAVSPRGLALEPSSTTFRRLLIFLGVPVLDLSWAEVDQVEEVRGVMPMSAGVTFLIHGKRLIWWCKSSGIAKALIEEVSRYVPERVVRQKRRLVV